MKKVEKIIEFVLALISLVLSGGVTYAVAKYMLVGIAVERGYHAVGSEYAFFGLIFIGAAYVINEFMYIVINEVIESL